MIPGKSVPNGECSLIKHYLGDWSQCIRGLLLHPIWDPFYFFYVNLAPGVKANKHDS